MKIACEKYLIHCASYPTISTPEYKATGFRLDTYRWSNLSSLLLSERIWGTATSHHNGTERHGAVISSVSCYGRSKDQISILRKGFREFLGSIKFLLRYHDCYFPCISELLTL